MKILDRVRVGAHRAVTTTLGDAVAPVRLSKDLLRRANVVLGQPLCSAETLEVRRAAEAKLAALRQSRGSREAAPAAAVVAKAPRIQAPVTIYFERDRNVRELTRLQELFAAKGIEVRPSDVAGDPTTLDFVKRTAHVDADQLPVVFVADRAIGGYGAVVDADVSGELDKLLFGS